MQPTNLQRSTSQLTRKVVSAQTTKFIWTIMGTRVGLPSPIIAHQSTCSVAVKLLIWREKFLTFHSPSIINRASLRRSLDHKLLGLLQEAEIKIEDSNQVANWTRHLAYFRVNSQRLMEQTRPRERMQKLLPSIKQFDLPCQIAEIFKILFLDSLLVQVPARVNALELAA